MESPASNSLPVIITYRPRLPIQVVVAGDAVHGGRRAGRDGHVVRAGEGRHGGARDIEDAMIPAAGEGGQSVPRVPLRDIVRISAIRADHGDGSPGASVVATVCLDDIGCGHVQESSWDRDGERPDSRWLQARRSGVAIIAARSWRWNDDRGTVRGAARLRRRGCPANGGARRAMRAPDALGSRRPCLSDRG